MASWSGPTRITARSTPLKTNKKGEYFSLGLTPGKYNVTLYKNADDQKAGTETDHVNGYVVKLDDNPAVDFDVKKEIEDKAKGKGLSAEDAKRMQEQQAKAAKETNTVKALNEKLNAAKTAADAGDFDTAIASLTEATQMDATRDLIWFKLGDYYRMSVPKQTDPAEKEKRLGSAIEAYQKAIDIKKAIVNDKDPNAAKNLARLLQQHGGCLFEGQEARRCREDLRNGGAGRSAPGGAVLFQYRRRPDQFRPAGRSQPTPLSTSALAADLPGPKPTIRRA